MTRTALDFRADLFREIFVWLARRTHADTLDIELDNFTSSSLPAFHQNSVVLLKARSGLLQGSWMRVLET